MEAIGRPIDVARVSRADGGGALGVTDAAGEIVLSNLYADGSGHQPGWSSNSPAVAAWTHAGLSWASSPREIRG